MAERRGIKRTYVSISSSSSEEEEEEEEEDDQTESESEEKYDGNDDDDCVEISASSSCDDDDSGSDDEGDESDEEEEESADPDDDESLCNNVIRLLRERCDLLELNLKHCKAYLRKHGLRITGTKAECVQRIREHWRIKDGNAEALYPRSSFAINCTGDVCKGDTVLFTQKVYKKFDKVTRSGTSIGKRTVAGRVVKESYGAAKQQHTFTIEVLWSQGIKKLPPLFPLLVKGRNLYKLKTFRQRWKNESERWKVLAEKHRRGDAARLVRAIRTTKKTSSKNGGVKRQKRFHRTGTKAELEIGKRGNGCGKAPMDHLKPSNHRQKALPVVRANLKKKLNSGAPNSSIKHGNVIHPNTNANLTNRTYTLPPPNFHQSQMPLHHHQWSAPLQFPYYEAGSASSTMGFPHFSSHLNSSFMPVSQHQGFNRGPYPQHPYSRPSRVFDPSNWNPSPELMKIYGQRR